MPGATSALTLHLVNYTGNMHETPGYRVEYVAPVAPFTAAIAVPPSASVVGVTRLIGGDRVPYNVENSELGLTVGELGTHETILLHLADGVA